MAKKLVVCCDGTWNTPRTNTNINQTFDFLRERLKNPLPGTMPGGGITCSGAAVDGSEVMLYYHEGVGNDPVDRLIAGAMGIGLSANVRNAYTFLAQHYEPGAEIYLFGFSRGAYTVRSLCGFISQAGLLNKPSERQVLQAYIDHYATEKRIIARPPRWSLARARAHLVDQAGDALAPLLVRGEAAATFHTNVTIRFVGVYDTVGALGVPLNKAARFNEPVVGFHNTSLSDLIEHAVHALAVDERRASYGPTLWTVAAGLSIPPGHSVLQVWFPGVHSDIGGGYPDDRGIGNITLDFMMREAVKRGLLIDPGLPTPRVAIDDLPKQHDSRWSSRVVAAADKVLARFIGETVSGPPARSPRVAGEVRLHRSLVDRFGQPVETIGGNPPSARYMPDNVTADTLPVFP